MNIALSITQMLVGLWAGSRALVADAVHSLSDLVSDFVVLFANRHSAADADKTTPGHGRFETAASLVIGVLLLSVGVGMLWSAAHKSPIQPALARCTAWRCGWPGWRWSARNCCFAIC